MAGCAGYRDLADVSREAAAVGLPLIEVVDMPVNNFMMVFRRQ